MLYNTWIARNKTQYRHQRRLHPCTTHRAGRASTACRRGNSSWIRFPFSHPLRRSSASRSSAAWRITSKCDCVPQPLPSIHFRVGPHGVSLLDPSQTSLCPIRIHAFVDRGSMPCRQPERTSQPRQSRIGATVPSRHSYAQLAVANG